MKKLLLMFAILIGTFASAQCVEAADRNADYSQTDRIDYYRLADANGNKYVLLLDESQEDFSIPSSLTIEARWAYVLDNGQLQVWPQGSPISIVSISGIPSVLWLFPINELYAVDFDTLEIDLATKTGNSYAF